MIDIKKEMMRLWKINFHDSDEYIRLLFDNYFDENLIATEIRGDRVVSALMGIPYSLGCVSTDNQTAEPRGLYLCGLSTDENFRGLGLMTKLIEKINIKAYQQDYDFTFLIPANSGLIKYYHDRGYVEAFYRAYNRYIISHDFKNQLLSSIPDDDILKSRLAEEFEKLTVKAVDINNPDEVAQLSDFVNRRERGAMYPTIIHTLADMEVVAKENSLSGGAIVVVCDDAGEKCGAAFIAGVDGREVDVRLILYVDEVSRLALLQGLCRLYADRATSVKVARRPESMKRVALWQPGFFGVTMPNRPAEFSEPYGMLRLLSAERMSRLLMRCFPKSVLEVTARDEATEIKTPAGVYIVGNEAAAAKKGVGESTLLSLKEFAEIIFRRPLSPSIITEAMGLPELPLNLSLMLD